MFGKVATLIFLALHVEHPVRLFLCDRRPKVVYPAGWDTERGFGKLFSGKAWTVGVEASWPPGGAESGRPDGGTTPDMTPVDTCFNIGVQMIGQDPPLSPERSRYGVVCSVLRTPYFRVNSAARTFSLVPGNTSHPDYCRTSCTIPSVPGCCRIEWGSHCFPVSQAAENGAPTSTPIILRRAR